MADVFVSYKAEDRRRVRPLVDALEADGLSVWWDAHIGGGDAWREAIERELDVARCVIVVWSKRSISAEGRFVRDEASRAQRRGTYLPLLIDRVEPPLGFGENQALPLAGWKGAHDDPRYRSVLECVRAIISGAPAHMLTAANHERGISRRTLVAGSAVTVVGAGAAGWLLFKPPSANPSNSVAVLPFANLSGDPDQAYFSEGIAEELRSALSRIAGLKVVARTSSEAVRDEDAKTAAHKLGVANILTGSVRRSPQMIRISAQLVDARDGLERWSDVYDRTPADALQIQTDIAEKVVDSLSIRLGGADRERIEEGGTSNPNAHDLVLKAEQVFQAPVTSDAVEQGLGMARGAIRLDPRYAGAWAIKSGLETTQAGVFAATAAQAHAGYAAATQSARRAIALAPNSRVGYARLASILDQQLQRRAARTQFLKMQSLPGLDGLDAYAMQLSETKRHEQAVRLIGDALARDPLSPRIHWARMTILGNARRYAEALAGARELVAIAPPTTHPHGFIGFYLMLLGRNREAEAELKKADAGFSLVWRAELAARQGNMATSRELLQQFSSNAGDAAYYQIAQILAQQGKKTDAIVALESAFVARDPGITLILVDPMLDSLRSDARFEELVTKLDFPT